MSGMVDRAVLQRTSLVLGVFLVLGPAAGLIWHAWWDAPTGVVFEDNWYLAPAGPDVGFAGTALYVVVASLTGLVAGGGLALRRGQETLTVLVSAVAALVAGWLMFAVGHALGPEDPRPLAQGREDLTELPAELSLAAPDESREPWRSTALAAMPAGALAGLSIVYVLGSDRAGRHVAGATPDEALDHRR